MLTRLPIRLVLFAVIPLFTTVAVAGMLLLPALEREFEDRMKKEVQMVARALQLPLTHALQRGRAGSIEKSLESAFNIGRVYGAYLYGQDGALLASMGEVQSRRERRQVTKVFDQGKRSGAYGRVGDRAVYSYFVPLVGSGGRIIGMLQVTRRASDIQRYIDGLRTKGGVALFVAGILLTVIVLVGYYGAVGRALGRLRGSMAKVQAGDTDHRADARGPREIGALAATLNAMLDSMARAQERLRGEQESRAQLERRLRESEKLAAIGGLAAGVAHELGTPLSVLDGRAQRSLRQHGLDADTRASLGIMRQEVRRMERIVRQLLDFGRTDSRQRSAMRLESVMFAAVKALGDEIEARGLEVDVRCPTGLSLQVDPVRIEQAVTNLVKNAVQAARQRVELSCALRAEGAMLAVDDDGPGIEPGIEQRMFEPFFTTKREEGTGLGLAIVYAVAREHEGKVEASRSPLGGARFCLSLPCVGTDGRQITSGGELGADA